MDPAGRPISETVARETIARAAFIHREILQLSALIVVAIAAFFLTRAVAASNREMSRRDAVEWYRRGQQALETGSVDAAIDSFRRATVRAGDDKGYQLALAHALALKGDNDAARNVLLTLREAAPEDAEINLQLARLAATRQDVTEALRFYHNALYAPWPGDQADARREVRVELIGFLLGHDQADRAVSELLALSTDLPDTVSVHLEVAQLFVRAGDSAHALAHFERVLRLAPENGDALIGAGLAAFQQGDYLSARTLLRRAPMVSDEVRNTLEVADQVLASDPLAKRLGSAERRRRLVADFSYARQRLNTCVERRSGGQATDDELSLLRDADAFADRLRPLAILEQDTVEDGVELIDRLEHVVVRVCGPSTSLDRALVLIGRRQGTDVP